MTRTTASDAPLAVDTIAAIASGGGECAVCLIRVSGPRSPAVLREVFPSVDREGAPRPRHAYVAHAVDPATGSRVDECLLTYFRGPSSYTGEDVLEIGCHGGSVSPARVFSALLSAGCVAAEPGEFTKRAFLNGKVSLSQAEAVGSLIMAKSEAAQQNALRQLGGQLGKQIEGLAANLRETLAHLEASLDFEEHEVPPISAGELRDRLGETIHAAQSLADTWEFGHVLQEGVRVILAGRPNTGKSSLMNALLREERAIVTHLPGTTRDVLESPFMVGRLPATLMDTAGITTSADPVERIGVARAMQKLAAADLAILVLDGSQALGDDDRRAGELIRQHGLPAVVALNKSDLAQVSSERDAALLLDQAEVVPTCALSGDGLDALVSAVERRVGGAAFASSESAFIVSLRHRDALQRSVSAAKGAVDGIEAGVPLDVVCVDVREALGALGEITGETTTDELLSAIFGRFCVGK